MLILMLILFDNYDVSSGSGDDWHYVNGLQSVKSKIECSNYLSFYFINATSLTKPHAIQLLQTELLNKDVDIELVTETLLRCAWTLMLLNQIMFCSVGIEVAEVVAFVPMFVVTLIAWLLHLEQ